MKKLIVVFGGAFNPITSAHLSVAQALINQFDIEKVLFMPVSDNYKKENLARSSHRINMLNEVCKKNKNFAVSTIEIDCKELLYTIDSLRIIKDMYPNNQITFFMGSDNLKQIDTWKEFDVLMTDFLFIVINRNGDNTEKIVNENEKLKKYKNRFIHFEQTIRNDGNSSYIRSLLEKGKSIRYLVPDEVYYYIKENKLYN